MINPFDQQAPAYATGTNGADFNIDTSNPYAPIFNLPDASASSRGVMNLTSQTIIGNKTWAGLQQINIGDTSSNDLLLINNPTTNPGPTTRALRISFGAANASGAFFIRFDDGDGNIGSVVAANATSVTYQTTSDRRLKENIVDFTGALDILDQVKPRSFTWKKGGEQDYGFIAQELKEVWPSCVAGEEQENVIDTPMGVDYGRITPLLTAALKELVAQVKTLQDRIDILEGA